MRSSEPMPRRTFSTSTSSRSQRLAISFMKEIFVASMALAAYFSGLTAAQGTPVSPEESAAVTAHFKSGKKPKEMPITILVHCDPCH